MIICEKLGPTDILRNKVLRGREGGKLDYLLSMANVSRDQCYITAAIKCPLPRGKKPKKAHKTACRIHLLEEIKWVRPRVIITLGALPLELLAPNQGGIKAAKGFPLKVGKQVWLIPNFSIEQTFASSEYDPVFAKYIMLAKDILKNPDWERPKLQYTSKVVTTIPEVKELADRLCNADQWSFDLETNGLDFQNDAILCASFSFGDKVGWVLPIDKEWDTGGWNKKEREYVLKQMKRIFLSPASKSAQNGKFDLKFLRKHGIKVRRFDFDTMIAHHLLQGSKPEHNLDFIAQWYGLIHERYSKAIDDQKKKHKTDKYAAFDPTPLFHYAGLDAAVTEDARKILEPKLYEQGLDKVFNTISMPQTMLLMHMEYYGVHMDREGMRNKLVKVRSDIEETTDKLRKILKTPDFNPRSTAQLKAYFSKKKIKLSKETATGGASLDEEVLKDLDSRGKGGEVPGLVLKLRSLTKVEGTYLENKKGDKGLIPKLDVHNYIHTNYNITGTYTGRLSSNNPNLQNIPRLFGIRDLFIPDEPGDEFLGADYKQLEVRVAAGISKDLVLIEEIREEVDLHSRNAATFLLKMEEEEFVRILKSKTPESVKLDRKRTVAKTTTFGVLYGSTAYGVSARNKIPLEDCEKFIKRFFRKYNILAGYIKNQHQKVRTLHKVVSPTGRYYHFPDFQFINSSYCKHDERRRRLTDIDNVACNMPIQSFGSDIFQSHKLKVFKYLLKNKMKSRLVLSLHDGFLLNVKPDEKEELAEMVPKLMFRALNKGTKYEVPLEVDVEFTDRWKGK